MMAIWLCADGHEEICFEGRSDICPVCAIIQDKDEKIEELNGEIDELKEINGHLNAED